MRSTIDAMFARINAIEASQGTSSPTMRTRDERRDEFHRRR